MKITMNVDCTPEEARSFLGLPDVGPLNAALLDEMETRMRAAMAAMEPEALMKAWFPGGLEGWEQLQKAFWSNLAGGGAGAGGSAAGARPGKAKDEE